MNNIDHLKIEISDLSDETLNQIYLTAIVYNSLFVNKYRVYTFLSPKREELILDIQKEQFMHLCGISNYNTIHNSVSFFEDCLSRTLSGTIFTADINMITVKINALQHLAILTEAKTARVCKSSTFLRLSVDKALRSTKELLALGLVNKDSLGLYAKKKTIKHYSSNSTLNLKHGDKSFAKDLKESYKVIKIITFDRITHETVAISENLTLPKKKKNKKKKLP